MFIEAIDTLSVPSCIQTILYETLRLSPYCGLVTIEARMGQGINPFRVSF